MLDTAAWNGYPGDALLEVITTAVRKFEDKPEEQLTYRARVLRLAEQSPPFDAEALKTDLFESDEECEAFIQDIYRYRRSFKA